MKPICVLALSVFCLNTLVGCGDAANDSTETVSTPQKPVDETEYNAAIILVQFRGCENAAGCERDRKEALKLAEEYVKEAREGADFYELAKEHSEHATASAGGILGNFTARTQIKPFVEATKKLEIGGISDPVETHFGYSILMRREPEEIYNASHILLLHSESDPAPPGIKRTKEETLKLAKEIREKVASGQNFNQLALIHSNGPGRKRGGQLGNFTVGQLPDYFGAVGEKVSELDLLEVSEPFETSVGVHLVIRQPIPKPMPMLAAKHILIMHKDSERADGITRSKEDALKRIESVQEKLLAGEDFSQLALEYSDCPSREKGGDLGVFKPGQMDKKFETALLDCGVGATTDIIETIFGYHIIYRMPLSLR